MDTLIANVTAVTMNERMDVLFGAYLGITDGKITYIGKEAPKEQPATIIDGTGMVAMPGLVNCHTHLCTAALRTVLDDASRRDALEQQLRREDRMDRRSAESVLRYLASVMPKARASALAVRTASALWAFTEGSHLPSSETGSPFARAAMSRSS